MSLQTQWRVTATMAGILYTGLDYTAAEALLRARRAKNRVQLLEDLQHMESAALRVLNKRV